MDDFKCVVPKVLFGAGRRKELGEEAWHWGTRVFLALDPYLQRAGVGKEIESLLTGASLAVVPYADIEPDPSCFQADKAAALAREERCDLVVAAGDV